MYNFIILSGGLILEYMCTVSTQTFEDGVEPKNEMLLRLRLPDLNMYSLTGYAPLILFFDKVGCL